MASEPTRPGALECNFQVIEGGHEDLMREFERLVYSAHPEDVLPMLQMAARLDRRGSLRLLQRGELEQADSQEAVKP